MAYESNPVLLAARAQLRSVDEVVAQSLSAVRPRIEAKGDLGYRWIESDVASGDGLWPSSARLSLSQSLYYGSFESGLARAENTVSSQRAELKVTEQQVLLDVVVAYMDVVLARSVLDLAVSNVQRLLRQFEATQERFRVGELTRTDVAQARARHANAQAERVRAEGALFADAARFEEVVGAAPRDLALPAMPDRLPDDVRQARGIASEHHPAIARALATERAARNEVESRLGEFDPRVNLAAEYTHAWNDSAIVNRRDDFLIELRLTVPLYQAGYASSRVREAAQIATWRRLQLDRTRREVEADMVRAWRTLEAARARIDAFGEEVAANTVALEGTEREAQVGERTVLDVLDAEQALFQSRVDRAQAERDAVVAGYTLQASTGRLTAAELSLPVSLHDPEEHHDRVRGTWWGYGE